MFGIAGVKNLTSYLKLIRNNNRTKLINGPISKTHFLKKKFPGITEYIGFKTKSKNQVMLTVF